MSLVKDARELDEQLSELVDWERFGVHLGMPKSEVDIIDRDKPDIANKKLTLFDKCLKSNPSLTWEEVIEALEKISDITLANKVKLAKLSCTNVSARETSLDQPVVVPVCRTIVSELAVLHKNFVAITENLKREMEIAVNSGSMSMRQIVSRTTEEQAFLFSKDFWHVNNVYEYFEAIKPFYSFLDCYLIVCLASLFVSSSSMIAAEANGHEKNVEKFMESTNVSELYGVLRPQSLNKGMSVQLTVVVQQCWGAQKLWLVEKLIRVLFGLDDKQYCRLFSVRPGSVVLDFLLPQRLIMFAIVQCVNKLEFLQLMGVIAIRVGTILVMRKTEDTKFSFQNSFIEACKRGEIEFVELLLRFSQVSVNNPSENIFLKQKDNIELSFSPLLFELYMQFDVIGSAFATAIVENDMIKLSNLMPCVHEHRPSHASFFNSVANKRDFFTVAQYFVNFLNVSFLVAIEKKSIQLCSDMSFDLENYAERIESIKKAASISSLEHIQSNELQKPPPGTILARISLSNEWRACSIFIIEKLVLNIFSILQNSDELQWLEISSKSNKILAVFFFPDSFQKELIESSKKKSRFMKSLGICVLKIGEEVVLKSNCDHFHI